MGTHKTSTCHFEAQPSMERSVDVPDVALAGFHRHARSFFSQIRSPLRIRPAFRYSAISMNITHALLLIGPTPSPSIRGSTNCPLDLALLTSQVSSMTAGTCEHDAGKMC
jgi:hypothetical protein